MTVRNKYLIYLNGHDGSRQEQQGRQATHDRLTVSSTSMIYEVGDTSFIREGNSCYLLDANDITYCHSVKPTGACLHACFIIIPCR
jgi:hypothetical protein